MSSKVGKLIKKARTNADLTQVKLAKKIGGGITAADISKAERGELDFSQAVLKKIAVATGITQSSLINAEKGTSKSSSKKSSSSSKTSLRLSASEKKLIEYYRAADSDMKKAAVKVLKGESTDLVSTLLSAASSLTGKPDSSGNSITDILGDTIGGLFGGK